MKYYNDHLFPDNEDSDDNLKHLDAEEWDLLKAIDEVEDSDREEDGEDGREREEANGAMVGLWYEGVRVTTNAILKMDVNKRGCTKIGHNIVLSGFYVKKSTHLICENGEQVKQRFLCGTWAVKT